MFREGLNEISGQKTATPPSIDGKVECSLQIWRIRRDNGCTGPQTYIVCI